MDSNIDKLIFFCNFVNRRDRVGGISKQGKFNYIVNKSFPPTYF